MVRSGWIGEMKDEGGLQMTQKEFLSDPQLCTPEVAQSLVLAVRQSSRLSKILHQQTNAVIMEAITCDAILLCTLINKILPTMEMAEISELQIAQGGLTLDPVVRLEHWLQERQKDKEERKA